MKVVTTNPNLTIVLPTNCTADCSFCSWRTSNQHKQHFDTEKFLKSLVHTLEHLPESCTQITISGGEPSEYKDLYRVMGIIAYHKLKNIQKVVFTTNGQNLERLSNAKWFTDVVDFVNLSRHHYVQDTSDKIFKLATINWPMIKHISDNLSIEGIALNINCVLSKDIHEEYSRLFVDEFVDRCRKNSVNSITFRANYDEGSDIHELEKLMDKKVGVHECPVCRKSEYLVNGFRVLFTNSEFEPVDVLGYDAIYEFILQPNGDLTSDWEGTLKVLLKEGLTINQIFDEIVRTSDVKDHSRIISDERIASCGGGPKSPPPMSPRPEKKKSVNNVKVTATYGGCGGSMSGCGQS